MGLRPASLAALVALAGCLADDPQNPNAADGACRSPGDQQRHPVVASDGAGFLVVWVNDLGPDERSTLHAARLSAEGVVDTDSCAMLGDLATTSTPAAASDGDGYLVVWEDRGNLWTALLSSGGQLTYPGAISARTTAEYFPSLAFDGSQYLAVWTDHRDGSDTYAARLTVAGDVLDPDGILLSTAVGTFQYPRVASAAGEFLAVWSRVLEDVATGYELGGARVQADGTLPEPGDVAIYPGPGAAYWPAVAAGGSGYAVAWQRSDGIHASRLSTAGAVLASDVQLSQGDNHQRATIASDGDGYLVAWSGSLDGSPAEHIHGTRLTGDGQVLDPAGLRLSTGDSPQQQEPAIAWNGASYLIAWQEDSGTDDDIMATRLSAAGEVLDPAGIRIAGGPPSPDAGGCSAGGQPTAGLPLLVLLAMWMRRRNLRRRGIRIAGGAP